MSIFQRVFRMGKAEVNSAIDKIEDPIKMTEQGIRDLKKDLNTAMTSLAEVKGQAIRLKKQAEDNKNAAADYEKKAMLLLQRAQSGDLDAAEADRLATEALSRKDDTATRAAQLANDAQQQEDMVERTAPAGALALRRGPCGADGGLVREQVYVRDIQDTAAGV